ncbi:MutS family DNA mismatch repair protein [Clostridium perfringens]|uniref:MutS family DNA mismatch repair protein n=1 Tax=Clostridium perfringens TaxID=1502 RepID=UPI0013E2B98B|nr:MutS family DNA mismatch repair protein [Clostridium perfringens]MDK0572651.1 DNA mismatch repair protein MutS [Clostridium perfringens]MDK0917255.1 DNA mismatch repair protein MutS [Clostridium perfringens]MDK0925850.1 DNA mismatch repair protein MutS [Clostridium perfringens]MDM0916884.1 DNA mismatch repair protein MutS [Clostridium perfringens]NGU12576.1 DNA mismatch repair protein MutS [Clostridium perfringens]
MENRKDIYEKRIEEYSSALKRLKRDYNIISALRLVVSLSILFFIYYAYSIGSISFGIILFLLNSILFLYLAKVHEGIVNKISKREALIEVNKKEILRLEGKWREFNDLGGEYLDNKHPFINDLDIFGKNSLFQWINETGTVYGREKLSHLLKLGELPNKEEILLRQEALKELSKKVDFRHEFIASLKDKKGKKEKYLGEWLKEDSKSISPLLNILRIIMPVTNIGITILVGMNIISWQILLISLVISYGILKLGNKEVIKGLNIFEDLKYRIKTYVEALELIEKENFQSNIIQGIKINLDMNGKSSSKELKSLEKITSWLYDRGNAFYLLLNCYLLWDYQILSKLEKWKSSNKDEFDKWMISLGDFEALVSLAGFTYNNHGWATPKINDDYTLKGKNLSHPMLGEKGVGNSFDINKDKRVILITGSNMSGKSTFLRTVGFNCILAYLGLPVKGESFEAPILKVYTCMRTGDNLEESISSFYAEILRIKIIVEGVKRGEKILFLLDEIFKGTNSLDRHEGAEILINQLLEGNTLGLVSTHDFELCDMEKKDSTIQNYNFREYYEDNKLKFDYILRKGVSQTRNARYLMKMAGIDIE